VYCALYRENNQLAPFRCATKYSVSPLNSACFDPYYELENDISAGNRGKIISLAESLLAAVNERNMLAARRANEYNKSI
jgi:hypothetical protein